MNAWVLDVAAFRLAVLAAAVLWVWGDRIWVRLCELFNWRWSLERAVAALASPDPGRVATAESVLRRWPGAGAVDRLADLLTSADHELAVRAARLLNERTDPASVRALDAYRRRERLLRQADLPPGKNAALFDVAATPPGTRDAIHDLLDGRFAEDRRNVVLTGRAGAGKTHLAAVVGHALVARGVAVLFVSAARLIEELELARAGFYLHSELARLDQYHVLILDDLPSRGMKDSEMFLLGRLIAHRAGARCLLITCNAAPVGWAELLDGPDGEAIGDRLLTGALVLELAGPSRRAQPVFLATEPGFA